ncbi:MAG: ORF6N domain-containing protein [Ignavibacteria bacterium]|nr:ORF6N domain-containing protein [Ignavibacteria bacterium]
MKAIVPIERIENRIIFLRGEKILIDRDLAELYHVQTKVLNQAVKRNIERFPKEFMFQLTKEERKKVVTNCDHLQDLKFSYQLPYAFTELGVAMLSSVLKSKRAIQVNIQIMKTFVKLRQMYSNNKELSRRIDEMEKRYDGQFKLVFSAMRRLLEPPPLPKKEPMGFVVREKTVLYKATRK